MLATNQPSAELPEPQNDTPLRRALNEEATAQYTGISQITLRHGRMGIAKCLTPPYVRLGRKIVYLKDDLDRFLESNRQAA